MEMPFGSVVNFVKKSWSKLSFIFGNLEIEPKKLTFDKIKSCIYFSINLCNTKNTKLYIKNIGVVFVDEEGGVEYYRAIFQHIGYEYLDKERVAKYEQFSSCTIDARDILVAKRLFINNITEEYLENKIIYLEYTNQMNKTKRLKLEINK